MCAGRTEGWKGTKQDEQCQHCSSVLVSCAVADCIFLLRLTVTDLHRVQCPTSSRCRGNGFQWPTMADNGFQWPTTAGRAWANGQLRRRGGRGVRLSGVDWRMMDPLVLIVSETYTFATVRQHVHPPCREAGVAADSQWSMQRDHDGRLMRGYR